MPGSPLAFARFLRERERLRSCPARFVTPSTGAASGAAEAIYTGGQFLTMNDAAPTAEAVAVRGGTILAVGSRAQVEATRGPATRTIDLRGRTMLPGMIFTTRHDAPVAEPDPMRVLSATVTRRSRSGDIIGPHRRVPVEVALKAMTLRLAFQHFEEESKGS
ncbi:MAG: amidohydrolase family protein, partial [Elioraea sp.]|nr:amidohydrolase family protein [Elioraea sp.]